MTEALENQVKSKVSIKVSALITELQCCCSYPPKKNQPLLVLCITLISICFEPTHYLCLRTHMRL